MGPGSARMQNPALRAGGVHVVLRGVLLHQGGKAAGAAAL